jgi:hypothetical protein
VFAFLAFAVVFSETRKKSFFFSPLVVTTDEAERGKERY